MIKHPAFTRLVGPHAAVHANGKKAAELFAKGERAAAREAIEKMEEASGEVVKLLDDLRAGR